MLLAMIWSAGWAQTTIDVATVKWNNGFTQNPFSFTAAKGDGQTNPTKNTSTNDIRLYAKNTLTVSTTTGAKISKIVFYISNNGKKQWAELTSTSGTVVADKAKSIATWENIEGATSVTFTVGDKCKYGTAAQTKPGQFFFNSVDIYELSEGKTATDITFPTNSFIYTIDNYSSFTGQAATLTSEGTALTGKTITYSKSGDDIFSSFNTNDGTLALNGNPGKATVTATFAGDDTYASSSASYTISVKEVVKDIATLKEKITSSSQNFTLKLTDAIVTYKNGNILYIQDKTAGIYCSGATTLDVNDKVNGLVDITAYIFKGQRTITQWTLAEDATIDHNVEFTPEVVTLAELNANID